MHRTSGVDCPHSVSSPSPTHVIVNRGGGGRPLSRLWLRWLVWFAPSRRVRMREAETGQTGQSRVRRHRRFRLRVRGAHVEAAADTITGSAPLGART